MFCTSSSFIGSEEQTSTKGKEYKRFVEETKIFLDHIVEPQFKTNDTLRSLKCDQRSLDLMGPHGP